MRVNKSWLVSALLVSFLLFSGVYYAVSFDSDFGKVYVKKISIKEDKLELSGLLYRPASMRADEPAAAVILAHGIGGSKEMMSCIGLELARRGFISLCLDLYGHGQSQGTVADGRREPSFGVYSAVNYLRLQPFVNSSSIILIGHSLGAGAVRAAAQKTDVAALILIAGGLGVSVEALDYANFNATFPKNLLVIVGRYDVLFNAEELADKVLPSAFGINGSVVPGMLYGDFSSRTARKIVVSPTTHILEPLDPTVIRESINWVKKTVGKPEGPENLIYLQRELSVLMALLGALGAPILALYASESLIKESGSKMVEVEEIAHRKWRLYLVWGLINLVLFIPLFIVGLYVLFPPLVFGSSVAWWLLVSGLVGLMLITEFSSRLLGRKLALRKMFGQLFFKENIMVAAMVFVILYAGLAFLDWFLAFNFRVVVTILKNLSSIRRVLAFAAFIPFFLPYFIAEGLYLNRFAPKAINRKTIWSKLQIIAEKIFGKIAPLIFPLSLQYAVKIGLDFWLIPSFLGFLLDFLWLIAPLFIIAIVFSHCFYEKTGEIFSGALFNTLLFAWVASTAFPF